MYNFKNKNYKIFGITSSKYQLCPTKVSNHLIKNRGRYRANTVFFTEFLWMEGEEETLEFHPIELGNLTF